MFKYTVMRLVKGYHCLHEFDIADLSLSINHPGKLSDPPYKGSSKKNW